MFNFQNNLLLCDKEVARLLSMSDSWVRQQRFLRKHNKDHCLDVNPIMVGNSPRYRTEDINSWLNNISGVCND